MYSSINAIITPSSSSSSTTRRRRRSCFSSRGIQELKSKAFGVGVANTNISCLLSWSRSKSNWLLFKVPKTKTKTKTNGFVSVSPPPLSTSISMEMQTCSVKMEVDVPTSVAYQCYSDREAMPKWMPFISSVKILEDKPDQSRWTLKYKAFGRDIEFSWLARNLQPIPNQKIHWRSLEGLPNSGAVRFYPRGPSSCLIELSVSYEVPQLLAPVASALQPFLESLLLRGLERFSKFAKSRQPESAN